MNKALQGGIDHARQILTHLVDKNGDGKIDKKDAELVLAAVEQRAEDATRAHPAIALVAAAAIGAFIGFFVHVAVKALGG